MKLYGSKLSQKATSFSLIILWFFCFLLAFLFYRVVLASPAADDLKDNLRFQIDSLQQEINGYRKNISDLQTQSKSLKNQISILDVKIKAANLEIRSVNLEIQETENEIAQKDTGIQDVEMKLDRERVILAEYIRQNYEYDKLGMLDIILKNENLSDIFQEINSFETIQKDIQESMVSIIDLKEQMKNDKDVLEDKKGELNELKVLQEIQRQSLAADEKDKQNILSQTKGQEGNYQKLMVKAKADAESIRKQLYLLEGVGVSMTLEKAYEYAKKAGDLTGVRPAFLLAVLKKESSWGQNVGTGFWRQDMNNRDKQAFIEICEKLNLDPDKTPVSRKPSYGWGGAMGPAQFLPATWLQYEDRVAQLTGHNPPDPWDIEDAFVAAGIKMAQGGANAQNPDAEWKAAQIYFAGSRWNNPTYYFYGDQVMELAGVIQEQLDVITK